MSLLWLPVLLGIYVLLVTLILMLMALGRRSDEEAEKDNRLK